MDDQSAGVKAINDGFAQMERLGNVLGTWAESEGIENPDIRMRGPGSTYTSVHETSDGQQATLTHNVVGWEITIMEQVAHR